MSDMQGVRQRRVLTGFYWNPEARLLTFINDPPGARGAARRVPPYLSKTALRRLPPPRLSAATGCSRWTGGDSDHESGATAVFYHPVPEAPVWPDPRPPSSSFPAFLISLGHPI